ncbi:MAG: BREX-1 system adenine-specific DNA-methyltransferase PglX [Desulfobacteraceae bacterium]
MNTAKLKQFASIAGKTLIEQVSSRLSIVLDKDSIERRINFKAVEILEKEIKETSKNQVIEKTAYIWFNRFCALRFMDVNNYTSVKVLSPLEGFTQPEILMEAKQGHIDDSLKIESEQILGLLSGKIPSNDPQQEAYRIILKGVCNYWHGIMPFLFEKISDYTELLMPYDLLSESSVISMTRNCLGKEECENVEVIGWLYQFYISEKKDGVFADLKKNKKITPENIPAATQLFTPSWIVKYLVENSLGRLWMLNNPDSFLAEKMDYYIKHEKNENDFIKINSPKDLKICDPACGSGHMLVYAFEILYFIYEEQGFDPKEIPYFILKHNLYGIEIDERAKELACFALCMKAREKYKRFFKKPVSPNICALKKVKIDDDKLFYYLDALNLKDLRKSLETLLRQFENADNFGSLISPEIIDIDFVLNSMDENKIFEDIFLQETHSHVLTILNQAKYLYPKYDVVIANPPYMGGKGMNQELSKWAKNNYPDTKSDLFAMFIKRCLELSIEKGMVSMVTMQSWMFLSSFEKFRQFLLNTSTILSMAHIGTRGFDSIGGEVVSTTAFVLEKFKQHEFKGGFARLVDGKSEAEKEKSLLEAVQNPDCGWFYRACSEDFKKIPGCPVAYWASENVKKIFVSQKLLSEYFELCQGLSTSDNNRFIRFWYEVKKNKISILNSSNKNPKWFPLNKGGGFRKWYGNNLDIINWEDNGEELKRLQPKSVIRNSNKYLKSGVTWGKITSALFSARITSNGYLFSDAGMKAFCENDNHLLNLVGLFCSKITSHLLSMLSETLNFEQGNISRIPYINVNSSVVNQVIKYSNLDWDTYETSWDFKTNPFLNQDIKSYDLKTAYEKIRAVWLNMTNEMKRLEKENNEIFIRAYGLEDELSPEVPLNEITLTCNPNYRYGNSKSQHELENLLLSDTIKEFISYSVGCMFGRYSIDKKGLVLADKGQNLDDFLEIVKNPLFMPDKDNVIPIMDIDWFKDDMAERFKQFLKTVSGEENYEKNLEFIENAIGKDIRKFFLNDFYNYHVKMYKKRPVYWLFSSPNGSFNAFIYMHRYRKDTVSIVLYDYLMEFRAKLEAALENFIHIESSLEASQKEKLKAKKEEEKIKKVINEIEEYEREVLYPLASEQIEIDLDDGVKVNYPKFGKALKKIPGLSD